MKKVVVAFLFLMFFSSFAAAGVLIETHDRAEVIVNVWPADFGELVATDKGFADANGSFVAGLGVSSGEYTLQVIIRINGKTYKMGTFEKQDMSESLVIDCASNSTCLLGEEKVVEPVVNDSIPVVNDSVDNVSDDVNEDVVESGSSTGFVSKSIGVVRDNSLVSIGVLALVLAFVIFMVAGNGKSKSEHHEMAEPERKDKGDSDDELESLERKMKETEGKIVKAKKLGAAKKKLADEEAELAKLERGGDEDEVKEQKEDVEEAEEKVEEAEEKLEEA